jgi:hypothetical protein
MTNLTFEHKLVEELPLSGFLSGGKPVGREGYEVIVLERVGAGGSRYYCSLAPGGTLGFSEQIFGSFYAYSVDTRSARVLEINEQFPTANPLIKVKVTAKVLYRVIVARRVAIEVEDPLGKFHDRILGVLRREIGQLHYQKISEPDFERIIVNLGEIQIFGLAVEAVDLIAIEHDGQVLRGMQQRAELDYNCGLGLEMDTDAHSRSVRQQQQQQELKQRELEARLQLERLEKSQGIELQRTKIDLLNMRDLNTLLHLRPELTQEMLRRLTEREQQDFKVRLDHDSEFRLRMLLVLDNYIRDNENANPDDLLRLIREASAQSSSMQPRIAFGSSPSEPRRIAFGVVTESQNVPPATHPQGDDDD